LNEATVATNYPSNANLAPVNNLVQVQNGANPPMPYLSDANMIQKRGMDQRFLDLNDLIDDSRCQRNTDTPNALSDASTGTPREPMEDIHIYDGFDASLNADIMPTERAMPAFKPVYVAPRPQVTQNSNETWQCSPLGPGLGYVSAPEQYPRQTLPMNQGLAQMPLPMSQGLPLSQSLPMTQGLPCSHASGQVWPPQWQWTAPPMSAVATTNSIAQQFSTMGMSLRS
jgi:hypothetical protein